MGTFTKIITEMRKVNTEIIRIIGNYSNLLEIY